MREQVSVLPPPERRKPIISLNNKREEGKDPIFRKCQSNFSEGKSMEKARNLAVISRDQKPPNGLLISDKSMKKDDISDKVMEEESSVFKEGEAREVDISMSMGISVSKDKTKAMATAPPKETVEGEEAHEEGELCKNKMKNTAPSEDGILLQWGHRKRPRCSRIDNHHSHPTAPSQNPSKHSALTDESSVLSRKTVRVKADKVSVADKASDKVSTSDKPSANDKPSVRGCLPSKDSPVIHRNGVPRPLTHVKPEIHAEVEEPPRKRPKIVRGTAPSESVKGNKVLAFEHTTSTSMNNNNNKRGLPGKPDLKPPYHSKSRSSADRDRSTAVVDRTVNHHHHHNRNGGITDPCTTVGGGHDIISAKVEFEWPKFLICLSRKEKEDDFLIIKGTKLPQRPKRRSKNIEKTINFCTPGTWLSDLTHGRYDVREKKCTKKKPRGLKAMESMDSDSE